MKMNQTMNIFDVIEQKILACNRVDNNQLYQRDLPDWYFKRDGIIYNQYKYAMQKILSYLADVREHQLPNKFHRINAIEDKQMSGIVWGEIYRYFLWREEMYCPIPVYSSLNFIGLPNKLTIIMNEEKPIRY